MCALGKYVVGGAPAGGLHNVLRLSEDFLCLSALQLGHVGDDAGVGAEQGAGSLQSLVGMLGGGQQLGRPLPHLDLMVDLLLQVRVLKTKPT